MRRRWLWGVLAASVLWCSAVPGHRSNEAHATAGPAPVPVRVRRLRGHDWLCHLAPYSGGAYLAAHCLGAGYRLRLLDGGPWLRWSVDKERDLAHTPDVGGSAGLRAPAAGELASWHSIQGRGRMSYAYDLANLTDRPGQPYQLWCVVDGDPIIEGDSGSGLYAESDGALVGVVTNTGETVGACRGHLALAVGVP